ncbi:hypothetical protein CSA17_02135 [bacterium DOLJORAL78_65_58]|nr:MAG: hypothetical protein CSB20_05590 [bacterium DOLZORAL124_64_63]PIE76458.1 MAG: hypothetical protein CSA17_02135 [bacterium DOLJORAL78_65_58]
MRTIKYLLLSLLLFCWLVPAVALASDVEYSTAGAMDTPATDGGDWENWGTDFVTRWDNDTGHDVRLDEFAWPCGGVWAQFWFVWIRDTLPEGPFNFDYYGSFLPASQNGYQYPPSSYTYIDVSDEGVIVPAGATMMFGYSNPGMAGQIQDNGVTTWSYYNDQWDDDSAFGRTTIMQFKGSFVIPSAAPETPQALRLDGNYPNPFNPRTTISFSLPRDMGVRLDVLSATGKRVCRLIDGQRSAGAHEVVWDGRDQGGRDVSSGIYFTRLETAAGVRSGKMILTR